MQLLSKFVVTVVIIHDDQHIACLSICMYNGPKFIKTWKLDLFIIHDFEINSNSIL